MLCCGFVYSSSFVPYVFSFSGLSIFDCPFGCSLKFIYNIILKPVGWDKDTEEKSLLGKLLFANTVLDFINIPNILHHKTVNARISQLLKNNMSNLFHIILIKHPLQAKLSTNISTNNKKSLKIPKGQSEAVNRRRTDNTMAKRKRKKERSSNDLQSTTQKTKAWATQTSLITGVKSGAPEG